MRSRPGDPDRHRKCTGRPECRVTALSTTGRLSTDPVHDPRGSRGRGTVLPCDPQLIRPVRPLLRSPLPRACGRRSWRWWRPCWRWCAAHRSPRPAGRGPRPFPQPADRRSRPRPRPQPTGRRPRPNPNPGRCRTAAGVGRWPGGPRSYGAGSPRPAPTGGATGASTSPRSRVRRCSPRPRDRSRSRGGWRGAGCWRSRWPAVVIRRCGPRTNRCGRSSRRARRWWRGRWWRSWRRGPSTARRAVCTGACGAVTRIWIRCRCCRRRCCGGARPGCFRCSAYPGPRAPAGDRLVGSIRA